MLPVFSNLQDDKIALQRAFHKVIIMTGFINFSVLAFLSANAESLFVLLYTDSWISAVPFFQLLCIEGMFLPLHILAGNLLIAKGKSQKFMYIEISKRIFQAAIIYFSLESIEIIIYGQLTIAILYTLIGFVIAQIEIEYKFLKQIKTLFPYILIAGFIFVLNFYLFELFRNFGYFISIFINLIISLIFYITIGYIFKIEAFQEIFNVLTDRMKFQKSKLK
jgi:O-antigen/teichoic acid export membrane protein